MFCPNCNILSLYRTGIITFGPVSCYLMAALLSLEGRPALWPFGILPPRHPASKPSWPPPHRPAMRWPSAQTPRCASLAAAMETLPSGTSTTRHLSGGPIAGFFLVNCIFLCLLRLKDRPFSKPFTFRELQAIPRPHRWCQLYWHLSWWHKALDRWPW